MITENALQAQTIRLQQTVIGILQEAANTGRGLTRNDLDRLIAAQKSARDGSLRALNGQYDRIAYRQPMSGMIRERPIEVATYQHEPAQLTIEPASYAPRQSSPTMVREASSRAPVEEMSHRSAIVPPPPPPTVQREFARLALGPPPRSGSQRGSRRSSPHRAATAAATIDAKVTPPEVDRVSEHQERRSRAGSPPSRRKSTSLVTHAPKAPASERKASSLVHSAPSLMDKGAGLTAGKTNATQVDGKTAASVSGKNNATQDDKNRAASTSGKTNATQIDGRTAAPAPGRNHDAKADRNRAASTSDRTNATQVDGKTAAPASGRNYDAQADRNRAASTSGRTNATQVDGRTAAPRNRSPSKSRRDSVVPPAAQNGAPVKRSASVVAQAPKTAPSTTSHIPREETAQAPPAPKSTVQKALDTTPYELFCKYSLDLQYSRSKPLSSSFRPSADHRCPSCQIRIPVDTRDVWVLSTHFPGKENRHRVREYRMDSRFVVKCHRPEGGFACVLCDRFRDMDCLCKSVEALVKHLGTAHTPDEFERDPDLVRIKEGSGVGVNSREMVYV